MAEAARLTGTPYATWQGWEAEGTKNARRPPLMGTVMKLEKQKRMLAILAGEIPLEEIKDKDLRWLEQRVFDAIAIKKLQDSTKITFTEHRTLQ
jgi:hypothetical protein